MFEITSTGIGTFEVSGRFMGMSVDKVELVFQVNGVMICVFSMETCKCLVWLARPPTSTLLVSFPGVTAEGRVRVRYWKRYR